MNKAPQYGPQNPHPLSTLKTELVWEGKYDEYGRRREVDVAGCAMPMQRIETIDQPRSEAAAEVGRELFEEAGAGFDFGGVGEGILARAGGFSNGRLVFRHG
jgi:adenine-specific DNA-methyltransferase